MSSSGHREKSPTLVASGRRSGTTTDRTVTSRTVSSVTSTSRRPRLAPETGRRRLSWCHDEGNHVGRTREVVASFFDGLDLVDPGVVKVTEWRPRSEMEAEGPTSLWGGVARRP